MHFIRKYLNVILSQKINIVLITLAYIIGIVLGLTVPTFNEKLMFGSNTVKLFLSSFSAGGRVSSVVFNRVFTDIFCYAIFVIASLAFPLIVVDYFVTLYRGYIVGAIGLMLISNFGLSGLVLFIVVIFLQNIISTIALILMSCISIYNYRIKKQYKSNNPNYLKETAIISAAIIVLGIIIEVLLLLLFIRPMNYCF